jgi:elongation factor G
MEDEDSITEDEVHAALRAAVMDMSIILWFAVQLLKIKVYSFY